MGDFNAKVGSEQDYEMVGKQGRGSRNERGENGLSDAQRMDR